MKAGTIRRTRVAALRQGAPPPTRDIRQRFLPTEHGHAALRFGAISYFSARQEWTTPATENRPRLRSRLNVGPCGVFSVSAWRCSTRGSLIAAGGGPPGEPPNKCGWRSRPLVACPFGSISLGVAQVGIVAPDEATPTSKVGVPRRKFSESARAPRIVLRARLTLARPTSLHGSNLVSDLARRSRARHTRIAHNRTRHTQSMTSGSSVKGQVQNQSSDARQERARGAPAYDTWVILGEQTWVIPRKRLSAI